jgi:hypothetical protein
MQENKNVSRPGINGVSNPREKELETLSELLGCTVLSLISELSSNLICAILSSLISPMQRAVRPACIRPSMEIIFLTFDTRCFLHLGDRFGIQLVSLFSLRARVQVQEQMDRIIRALDAVLYIQCQYCRTKPHHHQRRHLTHHAAPSPSRYPLANTSNMFLPFAWRPLE